MQNKHQKKFLLGVSQPPVRGSSRLGQNPKFVKGNKLLAPLTSLSTTITITEINYASHSTVPKLNSAGSFTPGTFTQQKQDITHPFWTEESRRKIRWTRPRQYILRSFRAVDKRFFS